MVEDKTLIKKVTNANIYLLLVLIAGVIFTAVIDKLLVVIYFVLAFALYFYKLRGVYKVMYLKKN